MSQNKCFCLFVQHSIFLFCNKTTPITWCLIEVKLESQVKLNFFFSLLVLIVVPNDVLEAQNDVLEAQKLPNVILFFSVPIARNACTCLCLKKVLSGHLGQIHVVFPARQTTFYSNLPDREGPRQVFCQLNIKVKIKVCPGQAKCTCRGCLSEGQAGSQVFLEPCMQS